MTVAGGLFSAFERLRLELPSLLHQDLDFSFGSFQLLAARVRQSYAFFEELKRLLQREVSFFELLDDLLQLLQTVFKFGQGEAPSPL